MRSSRLKKVEQLALIDRLPTHHDPSPPLNASSRRNHVSWPKLPSGIGPGQLTPPLPIATFGPTTDASDIQLRNRVGCARSTRSATCGNIRRGGWLFLWLVPRPPLCDKAR